MLPRNHPDRIRIAFDDRRLVANAGLLLPATLARHLGLPELVHNHLDLGRAPGRANTGDKMMTLVASALAGGDCIDDADVLRTGGRPAPWAARSRRHPPWAPSCAASGGATSVNSTGLSRQLLARAWQAGARPGDAPVHHRPRFHHLRDLRTGQGGRTPPRLHRRSGLSPATDRRRRHRRRADGPAAGGPRQYRSGRRPLPA